MKRTAMLLGPCTLSSVDAALDVVLKRGAEAAFAKPKPAPGKK